MDLDDLFDFDNKRRGRKHGHRDDHVHDDHAHRYDAHDEHPRRHTRDDDPAPRHDDREERQHHHDREYPARRHHDSGLMQISHVARRLMANKALLILAALFLVALVVLFFVFVLPLLGQAADYLNQNGIKGTLDTVLQGQEGKK